MKHHEETRVNVLGQKIKHTTDVCKQTPFVARVYHEIHVEERLFSEDFLDINKAVWESIGREMGWLKE